MIQPESDAQKRDEYIQHLMQLPNQKWMEIIGQTHQNVEFLKDQDVIRTVDNILPVLFQCLIGLIDAKSIQKNSLGTFVTSFGASAILTFLLGKMIEAPKRNVQINTPDELAEADGFVFCFPTRFGMMAAQLKAFLDDTVCLWRTQQHAGKPARIFDNTGSQGGEQVNTALYRDRIMVIRTSIATVVIPNLCQFLLKSLAGLKRK
ncbi:unnamed protein product [Trifolium pratense]|uniref:Uncharacterized protein n=1 Tax=Trifolium pratense TaxID=57577 RepID=A0ACB0L2C3_TRIPR|nr:unnamed protein product [Trifolium pratense]